MKVPSVDLKAQYLNIKGEIDQAIGAVLEGGQFIGGELVGRFESAFATLQGAKNCVGVGNGTDALFIALKVKGISTGDEIITPALGAISSAETITLAGGKVVFADILPDTFTLDPRCVEERINERTKGVILVHLYGQAGDARLLKEICEKRGLFLIEDCAQAHLTSEFGIPVGNIGDVGTFSFYPTKNLGAYGDAGCIIASDPEIARKARLYANHGGLPNHLIEGINSRLDTLQAAILTVKCRYLSTWNDHRITNAGFYSHLLDEVDQIVLPKVRTDTRHTFHQYVIRAQHRDELRRYLDTLGIQTLIHFPQALHNLPAYRYLNHSPNDFPAANNSQGQILSLPIHPELSYAQINFVCDAIKEFYLMEK